MALTVIATVLIVAFNNRLNKAKDESYAREKRASDERIAAANAGAAEATRKAAEANEGLAKSAEKIAALTKEAEQAKTERAEADKQIAIAKTDALRAKEGIANAEAVSAKAGAEVARLQVVVANAEQKRAEAERALLQVQERIKPRRFSAEQEQRLIAALKASPQKGMIDITCVLGDGEAFAFASQIDGILKAAGWPTSGVSQGVFTPNNPVGFGLIVHSTDTAPAYAGFLQSAFRQAGIGELSAQVGESITAGKVQLLVGNKP